jgi:UDP-glucose:(heptosyl)LPS alpha-1,3-glucosyltransferase
MKIALIRQRYVAHGGAERYLAALAGELAGRGHEVHVYANRWEATPGIQFHRVPMLRVPGFLRALSFAWNVRRAVAGMDLVFSLERTLRQDLYRAGDGCHREWLARRRRFLPWWRRATLRINPLHLALLWLERRLFNPQNTRHVIANSQRGKEEIIRHYGFPAERITVVYNGVDTARFRPPSRPMLSERGPAVDSSPGSASERPDLRSLLFVGSGWERKGLAFAIRALALLPEHVTLRVVGKGNQVRYERLARQLGVAGRVQFLPPQRRIEDVYAGADVFVFPTIYEPFANVCLEALACGVPVVTTRSNGVAEILRPGVDGAVVNEPDNIAGLADAIRSLLGREAATAARATAERHSLAVNVAATLAVLETL